MAEAKPSQLPNWLPWVATILTLAGIAVAGYLTIAHYTTPTLLACPDTSIINCGKVTTSSYSSILGVPVALLGLLFFIAMLPLQLPQLWHVKRPIVVWGRLALVASGIPMVFWLVYVELYKLNAICIYCTLVHIFSVIIFGLTAIGTALLAD